MYARLSDKKFSGKNETITTSRNKQILEAQFRQFPTEASQNTSVSDYFPVSIIKANENTPEPKYIEQPYTEINAWSSPECIEDVAKMLEKCEDSEALALIRQCDIPSDIFKLAARQLSSQKREQLREWVERQNAESSP